MLHATGQLAGGNAVAARRGGARAGTGACRITARCAGYTGEGLSNTLSTTQTPQSDRQATTSRPGET